jgi:hypothetical protein
MKRTILALASIVIGVLLAPVGHASPDCPTAGKFQIPSFTYELDKSFTPPDPYYQRFISNFNYSSSGQSDGDKRIPLLYLSTSSDAEILRVNSDLKLGRILQTESKSSAGGGQIYPWKSGEYLLGYSNGAYAKYLYDLGSNLVISSYFEFSRDGNLWNKEKDLMDPFLIQRAGYGNDSYVRYTFDINVAGCSNPFRLSTNSVQIQGINSTEVTLTQIIELINTAQSPKFRLDRNSFYYSNFIQRDKFIDGYPKWLNDTKILLQSFDWKSELPMQSIIESLWAIGGLANELRIVALNPTGCLNYSENSGLPMLQRDCTLGIYMLQEIGIYVKYPRYILVGTVDVQKDKGKTELTKSSTQPVKQPGTQAGSINKSISCKNQSKILKVIGKNPKCPKGYSEITKK